MSSFPDTTALEHADSAMATIIIVDGQALQESDFEVATDIRADNDCSSIVSSECNAPTAAAGSSMDGAEMVSKALAVDDREAATAAPSVPDATFRAPSQSLLLPLKLVRWRPKGGSSNPTGTSKPIKTKPSRPKRCEKYTPCADC